MSLAILNLFSDMEVCKLPKPLQEEIYAGFEFFDRDTIAEAPIQTWRDFLMSSALQEGIENSRYWLDTLAEAKVKEEAKDNLFIVQVNVLDLPDVAYETHHKYKNLAIVDFGLPMLIKEVADTLGIKKNTLALWRMKGYGPKYYKLGRSVRYKKADVEVWISENIFQSTSQTNNI